jgi:hypothetical protein
VFDDFFEIPSDMLAMPLFKLGHFYRQLIHQDVDGLLQFGDLLARYGRSYDVRHDGRESSYMMGLMWFDTYTLPFAAY